jgi:glutamate--cysteine ligase
VLIQEGVKTIDTIRGNFAEPVVYAIANYPIGGFYRYHPEKSDAESLNAAIATSIILYSFSVKK